MRTVTITLYEYDELPTEQAKEAARDWWYNLEMEDPAWREEHGKSMGEAIKAVNDTYDQPSEVAKLREKALACEFTGYCADAILSGLIDEKGTLPSESEITAAFERAWDEELLSRQEKEHIEESIRINEYEFDDKGKIRHYPKEQTVTA